MSGGSHHGVSVIAGWAKLGTKPAGPAPHSAQLAATGGETSKLKYSYIFLCYAFNFCLTTVSAPTLRTKAWSSSSLGFLQKQMTKLVLLFCLTYAMTHLMPLSMPSHSPPHAFPHLLSCSPNVSPQALLYNSSCPSMPLFIMSLQNKGVNPALEMVITRKEAQHYA